MTEMTAKARISSISCLYVLILRKHKSLTIVSYIVSWIEAMIKWLAIIDVLEKLHDHIILILLSVSLIHVREDAFIAILVSSFRIGVQRDAIHVASFTF